MAIVNNIVILSQTNPEFCLENVVVSSGAATTITRAVPTKMTTVGAVVPMVDADGTTSQRFAGISKNDSTDTAAAAGVVDLWIPLPGYKYACKAKTASTADTQAEINALVGKRVIFDLTATGGTWSIDTAAADGSTNCVVIAGGDFNTSTIYFFYSSAGTLFAL